MFRLRMAAAAAASMMLAGCYVTADPLITQVNAAWPFQDGIAFTSYSWKEDSHEWEQSGSGRVLRVGDHYRLHPNPPPGEQADPDDDMDFLLSDFGDGYFAAEAEDKKDDMILLDVIKIDGGTILEYVMMCEPEDKKLADQGTIAKYEHAEFSDTCTVSSLDQLHKAFQAKLAAGMVPQAKYVMSR